MQKATSWAALTLVLLAVHFVAGPSSLGGPASYVIVDGRSMEPTYEDGDLVVAYQRNSYGVDDIIVYDAPVDHQFNVIHRIVERTDGGFITQGDNRDEPDGWIAPDDEIHGAALFHIPNGGRFVTFLRQPAAVLALLAGWLTFAFMDRQSTSTSNTAPRQDRVPGSFSSRHKPNTAPPRRRRRARSSGAPIAPPRRTSRLERRQTERAARRDKRSTAALLSLAVLIGGTGGIFLAHAAFLHVDAGVLQAHTERFEHDPAPPPDDGTVHTITVEVRYFNRGSGRELGGNASPWVTTKEVPTGASYEIGWNPDAPSTLVDCASDDIRYPDELPELHGAGTFTPDSDATHVLCVQTAGGGGENHLIFTVIDEPPSSPSASSTEPQVPDGSDADVCDGYEDASFCAGPSEDGTER